ncbi:hypothetical protein BKA64DRAFT_721097 [Cadophora sp. MPI-SDFR-AT-0126]|nr:hypothetical protein BKA64DRAFT_721097 [Leotiomycetes sp. MPI-SDFR-AT-0126]
MPLHFDLSWADRVTNTVKAALLLPLAFLCEFLFDDPRRAAFYIFGIYFQSAGIILSTTIYCTPLLAAGFLQYIMFTLVWIQMSLRLCLVAYTLYILGRSFRAICDFVITNPIYMILGGIGITQLPTLFKYVVPILTMARMVDRGMRAMIFKLNALVAKKRKPKTFIIQRVEVAHQGTQTVEAWDRIKEKVKIREMNRLDDNPNGSDEDWETDSEDGHGAARGRKMTDM